MIEGNQRVELILKAHMIIVDFLTLRMPGMIDRFSISIVFQKVGKKEVSISFEEAMKWQSLNLEPKVGLEILPPEIVLPGLLMLLVS